MNWLAILLSLASMGGAPATQDTSKARKCAAAKSPAAKTVAAKQCRKAKVKPRKNKPATRAPKPAPQDAPRTTQPAPDATPTPAPGSGPPQPQATPTPTATATPAPTPAPPGTYPTRTNVDLTDIREWTVRPSFRVLAAGSIDFNVNNRGEDDHNLSVRSGSREYGRIDLAPGDTGTLTLDLWLGSYTLYCSLPGHEAAGMISTISVR